MDQLYRVGLIWRSEHMYGNDAIRGIAAYGRRYGPWRISMSQQGDFDINRLAKTCDLDGILVCNEYMEVVNRIVWPPGTPVVSLERSDSAVTKWQVMPDNLAVGRMVAEEFLKRGFKHLAYCQWTDMKMQCASWDPDRLEGFSSVAHQANIEILLYRPLTKKWGQYDHEWKDGHLAAWLRSLPKPVGVMGPSDIRARHVLLSAEMAELRVPEEVAVIGVNNEPWAEITSRGMSCVELDGYTAGYAAAEMLHKLMQRQPIKPQVIRIPPKQLVIRQSSDALAIEDPDVVTAVHFIAERVASRVDVRQVVDAVPLSRRVLERRFQLHLGRSILDEIRFARLARAKNLLTDKEISLAEAARMSGFTSAKSMGAALRRDLKTTPTEYRSMNSQS